MENEISDLTRLQELDKKGEVDTSEARRLALDVYIGLPGGHQCYWNDRLYIAIRFGLNEVWQRAAITNSVVANGRSGYFEQKNTFSI